MGKKISEKIIKNKRIVLKKEDHYANCTFVNCKFKSELRDIVFIGCITTNETKVKSWHTLSHVFNADCLITDCKFMGCDLTNIMPTFQNHMHVKDK